VFKNLLKNYLNQIHFLHLLKQKEEVIITIRALGKLLGFTSEQVWHQFVIRN